MRIKIIPFIVLVITMLACAIPGIPAPAVQPLPSTDPNSLQTFIAQTAAVAQTQTALMLPTSTITPKPTATASITPTATPTFLWGLPTLTPIPTFTPPVIPTGTSKTHNDPVEEDSEAEPKKNKDEDPRKFTGKPWSCVVVGTYPPRNTVFKPDTKFSVQWTVFNAGTESWGINDIDFIFKSGFRNEEKIIQDLYRPVASGGEIKLTATFIAPKKANEYQSFFYMKVGNRSFCGMYYIFVVEEKK